MDGWNTRDDAEKAANTLVKSANKLGLKINVERMNHETIRY